MNTTMYRRDDFMRVGGYSPEMKYGYEDWEFYVRLLSPEAKVRYVDAPLYLYRVKTRSVSRDLVSSGRHEEAMRMIYTRNHSRYEAFLANPIKTFDQRMKDFAPVFTARYKRSLRYCHTAYGVALAVLLAVISGLLLAR
ncbi:galactosyltransferase-related protein [Paraburkholderia atlantica]|uniref:galactosyltransferase-related protein n=1 Tax=Paraburkholderia atlantica TaxID=2654982 RepID=UPI003D25B5F3